MKNSTTYDSNNTTAVLKHDVTSRRGFARLRPTLFATIIVAVAMPAMADCGSNSCLDRSGFLAVSVATVSLAQSNRQSRPTADWRSTLPLVPRFFAKLFNLFLRLRPGTQSPRPVWATTLLAARSPSLSPDNSTVLLR